MAFRLSDYSPLASAVAAYVDSNSEQEHNTATNNPANNPHPHYQTLGGSLRSLAVLTLLPAADMRYQIYCNGTLLEAVQKARLFADCKHFVDMPLKGDAGG